MKIDEAVRGNESINDRHIWDLIHECVDDINEKTGYEIGNDLMWFFGESTKTFGTTYYPTYDGGDFSIVLNKHMVGDDDEVIKNTICHELCHYIHNKEMFDDGILYWIDDDTLRYTWRFQRGRDSSHGTRWKEIAREVTNSLKLKMPITTYGSFSDHKNVGEYASTMAKYVVTCTNCGHQCFYPRATKVVKLVQDGHEDRIRCGNCKKTGHFKLNQQR